LPSASTNAPTNASTNLPPGASPSGPLERAPLPAAGATLDLSLISHTNVGKTTLARTLLGHDVGEVRDAAHVTEDAAPYPMVEAPTGERLMLWDTPGFGDSARLARRLVIAVAPLRWLMLEVWDRWRDRGLWSSQRATRHIVERSEVVLYLIDASQETEDAGYLDAELQVLDLIGKPVIALLNQLGAPQSPADEQAVVARWAARLQRSRVVRGVLPLDAFSRCWVQEGALLDAVAAALPPARAALAQRLQQQWQAQGRARWADSMRVLAGRLARAAADRQTVAIAGGIAAWADRLGAVGSLLRWLPSRRGAEAEDAARAALAERLDRDIVATTDQLIRLHGLAGQATGEVLQRLGQHYAVERPLDEGRTGLWSAIVTGALTGLKADIVSGGLTMGGGLLAGGVIGGLAGVGAARGVNKVRGIEVPTLTWQDAVLDDLARSALLAYLAVAHHGRGRGAWEGTAPPPFWLAAVDAVMRQHGPALQRLWARRGEAVDGPAADHSADPQTDKYTQALQAWLMQASAALLRALYPAAAGLLPGSD
jgi:predicted GTPase